MISGVATTMHSQVLLFAGPKKQIPPNPHSIQNPPVYQPETVAPSSAASSATTTKTQKLLRNRLLRLGQFCAVTGSATASLQVCHILNTVRRQKAETAEHARVRKDNVESFLTNIGILGRQAFHLDSFLLSCVRPPSIIPVDHDRRLFPVKIDIHNLWDKYASILISPPLEIIIQLTTYFLECNLVWQSRANISGTIPTPRPTIDNAYGSNALRRRQFNIHVLHSRSFLPHGESLLVCVDPPYLDKQHPTVNAPSTWETFHYDRPTSKLVRAADNTTPLTITVRHGDLSTVAVILNASAKIEDAQNRGWTLSSDVMRLKQAIDAFVPVLYYLPTIDSEGGRRTASEDSNTDGRNTPKPPDRDDFMDEDGEAGGGDYDNAGHEDGDDVEEEDDELEEDEELEEESDEEASRTLTPEEYDLALKKVVDPTVPIQERIQIGTLLLTKRCVPLPPHVADQQN
ncbi:hypothetical protein B0H11DRAFT_2246062 [Mycena galericulata]|nr:hypothetical protein B0H11DRAFT_2246062 [Mycena galericulata]